MRSCLVLLAACSSPTDARLPSTDVYAAGEAPRFVLGDLDGDGRNDLVVGFSGADRGIAVRRGDGRGTFGEARRALVGSATFALHEAPGGGDLLVADGQHLGVLPRGEGPMRVLGACRDAVLGAALDGVLTTDGRNLVLHSQAWDLSRLLEVEPLVPMALADVDGDGLGDLVGTALGRGAVRHATLAGLGPVRLLGEERIDGLALADVDGDGRTDVVTWSHGQAFAFGGEGVPIAVFTVPPVTTALAAGDLDGDGRPEVVVASYATLEIVGGARIPGPWVDVRQLAVERGLLLVADAGTRTIAVVRP